MAFSTLFTGLSGIQVHQTRTNVVADNIANINTAGFKSRRANFQDLMAQTIKQAAGPRGALGGQNPVQAGAGVKLKSVDINLSQGVIQSTGRKTDLAIDGDGFFILSDGTQNYFSREGSFSFDPLGRLINPSTGMVVQGNVADSQGTFGATTDLQSIQIDINQEVPGNATARVNLAGNIDRGATPTWTTGTLFTTASTITSTGFPTSLAEKQVLELLVSSKEGLTTGLVEIPQGSYPTIERFVDALNSVISGNERLAGKVLAEVDTTGQNVMLRTSFGGDDVRISLANVGSSTTVQDIGFAPATAGTGVFAGRQLSLGDQSRAARMGDDMNSLSQVGASLDAGDRLRFSGIRSDGTTFNGFFTYDPSTGLTSVSDFLATLETAFGDEVTAELSPIGKITLKNPLGSEVSGFSLQVNLDDSGQGSGLIGYSFEEGPPRHKIATKLFDSQGRAHSLAVTLTASPVNNQWYWFARIDNQIPTSGWSGTAQFDTDGSIRTFTPSQGEGTILEFLLGDVVPIKVDFTGRDIPERGINGLTQFVAPSSADVVDQDGKPSGQLDQVFVLSNGILKGRFTNGETRNLARVNLATFRNQEGLERAGGNLFSQTENTGTPLIEVATETIQSQIVSESLELSNVDMAQEFVEMIISQRGFQANARVVTTTDQLLAETVNLKQ